MSDLATKSIRFPSQSYVGFDPRPGKEDDFPLGFMTEDGTDKAAEKRKSTVDNWADKNNKPRTLPNKPMVGFRLSRSIRRQSGWGSGNVLWRIEDPRGFELEISSPNLAQIISTCVIDNGVILNECMWARLGGNNVLVPTHSDLYQTTKQNSERQTMSVKPSTVKIGNNIVLQNGVEGIYLGKMYEIGYNYSGETHIPRVAEKPKHLILGDHSGTPVLYDYASLKVAQILDESELTVKEAEARANELARWTANQIVIPGIRTEKLDDPKAYSTSGGYRSGMMLVHVPEFDDEWCVFGHYSNYHGISISAIEKELLDDGMLVYKQWYATKIEAERLQPLGIEVDTYRHWYGGNGSQRQNKTGSTKIDILARDCYRLYRIIETEAGNTFEWKVGA
jgi:hypothetical protein